jgi:hypothetical protein
VVVVLRQQHTLHAVDGAMVASHGVVMLASVFSLAAELLVLDTSGGGGGHYQVATTSESR